MIDEQRTLELFGYNSSELSEKSDKKIVSICINCGKERILSKRKDRDLCRSCSDKNRKGKNTGKNNPMFGVHKFGEDAPNYKGGKVTLICKQCGKEFEVTSSRKDIAKYCSKKCYKKYQSIPKNNYFYGRSGLKGESHPRYQQRLIILCKQCGKEFEVTQSGINRVFCSYKCKSKYQHENIKGENHPLHGTTSIHTEEQRIRHSCTARGINRKDFGGFAKEQKYCPKFNKSLKTQIRNQYNNCDYISGLHKDICNNGRSLDVHHVDYNKQQGCDDHQWKLIPLSKSNHAKTNANRSFWNRLFIYSLEYEAEYYRNE